MGTQPAENRSGVQRMGRGRLKSDSCGKRIPGQVKMVKVYILPAKKEIEVEENTTILRAEQLAGIRQDTPCGGYGICRKCKVLADGREVLACRTAIRKNMTVTVLSDISATRVLTDSSQTDIRVNPVREGNIHASVDLGTTTVVCYLMDGKDGHILDVESMLNPQFPYGADVISRIQAALRDDAMDALIRLVREGIWDLVRKCCLKTGRKPEEIGTFTLVGNPTMQQLFMGVSPENLARPPFQPVLTKPEVHGLSEFFPVESEGVFLVIPDVAGYVGADTMGCILSSGMYKEDLITLLVDIGTNGEMVLGNREKMVACSTAAGPALEGGRISCGMRAASGAVDHVWLESGEIRCSVIDHVEPKGFCGSGLIDAVAVMLNLDALNRRGRIIKNYELSGEERIFAFSGSAVLTQKDIREVQMAKGAIAAGITLLIKQMGITEKDIGRVILCGAFGSYMNPESAARIGLIPEILLPKVIQAGNAAGAGSRMIALNQDIFRETGTLLKGIREIELASLPEFQRVFASQMMFDR